MRFSWGFSFVFNHWLLVAPWEVDKYLVSHLTYGRDSRNARTGGNGEAMEVDGGAQLTTDKLAPALQVHILLLKYRRGELRLGARGGRHLNGGSAPEPR